MSYATDDNDIKPKAGIIYLEQPGVLESEFERLRAIKGFEDLTDEECLETVYAIRTLAIVFYNALIGAKELKINIFGMEVDNQGDQEQTLKKAA